MFIEIDDGVFVNLENVFSIQYKPYHNRGVWVFSGPALFGKEENQHLKIESRPFNSSQEARSWLKNIFYGFKDLSVYMEGSARKEEERKKRPLDISGVERSNHGRK